MVARFVIPDRGSFKLVRQTADPSTAHLAAPAEQPLPRDVSPEATQADAPAHGRMAARCDILERLVDALRSMLHAECDLLFCGGGADPAVDAWLCDAEASRRHASDVARAAEAVFSCGGPVDGFLADLAWSAAQVIESEDAGLIGHLRAELGLISRTPSAAALGCAALGVRAQETADLLLRFIDLDASELDEDVRWQAGADPETDAPDGGWEADPDGDAEPTI
ncbi:MAG: hypothetical protein ACXIUV_13535 [Alkalilacustris sp.]